MPDVVNDGKTGYVVTPKDPVAIADAVSGYQVATFFIASFLILPVSVVMQTGRRGNGNVLLNTE